MIATDRFVFLHLHKSGGSFVNQCLLRFLPGARELGYHLPRHLVPAEQASLPVLGLVRNPWSYYVSWYAYQAERPRPNALFRELSENGRLGFRETIANMQALGQGSPQLDALIAALPQAYGNQGINLPGFALESIRGSGIGFYSWLYRYMFGAADDGQHIGRMESLREELPRMLEAVGQDLSAELREFVRRAPPVNAGRHAHYADYYDRESIELVAARDAALIERHGYRFGD
jgi:hypothetical protein